MSDEIARTKERLANASEAIAQKADELKAVADQLRADVDALASRVVEVEDRAGIVAEDLITHDVKIEHQQVKQDTRLDVLEENGV